MLCWHKSHTKCRSNVRGKEYQDHQTALVPRKFVVEENTREYHQRDENSVRNLKEGRPDCECERMAFSFMKQTYVWNNQTPLQSKYRSL